MLIITAHAWDSDDSNPTITIKLFKLLFNAHLQNTSHNNRSKKLRLNFKRGLFLRYN